VIHYIARDKEMVPSQPVDPSFNLLRDLVERRFGRPKGRRNRGNHRIALDKLIKIVESKRAPAALQLRAAKIFVEVMMRAAGLWDG
jgi:hypothetical protein